MSSDFLRADNLPPLHQLSIDDLLTHGKLGAANASGGLSRRARKRSARSDATKAGLMAPLLAAQGCMTLGGDELPLGGDDLGGLQAPGGDSTGFEVVDDSIHIQLDQSVDIPAAVLLANDQHNNIDSLEIVRVFDAAHGQVFLIGDTVQFIPDEGFEGAAEFSYEVRAPSGETRIGDVIVHIGEQAGHGSGHDHMGGHHDDPAKMAEHMAVLNLVPVGDATHVAVASGSWFDPATWAGGQIPGNGARVHIPEGVSVAYDGESSVSLYTVRVDGMLEFATDQDTFMEVDTLVVAPAGHLTIGTIDNPVAADVSAIIQIADNGPIQVAWDPMLLSRGVISHGKVDIHGAEKTTFLKVAVDPMAGDTTLTLEAPPEGWQVGDRLVLTGTRLTEYERVTAGEKRDITTEDEEVIITGINGNVIQLDRVLQFDHDTPRADLKAYVANYSRNVQILTENADGLPVSQRGHVMLMHSDDIDVRYAEFHELGRTDKSERAFDLDNLDTVESDSNIKGRYSLHIHRAGTSDIDDPAMLVGNAVWGSPGWGYVHHDSNAILADNAAYDIFGAAFVSETGNEIGRWSHNIAIKSIGVQGEGLIDNPKTLEDVAAFDLGRTGAGFWFQSRMVAAVDNVAASIPGGQGFVYFHRGSLNDVIAVTSSTAPHPESLQYLETALINRPAIIEFSGNETLASQVGLMVVKANPAQRHDIRSFMDDFTGWNVKFGAHLEYTAHYTLKDFDLLAAPNGDIGITFGVNAHDMTVNNTNIVGFDTGVYANKDTPLDSSVYGGDFHYVYIDVNIEGATNNYVDGHTAAPDLFLTSGDLHEGVLTFQSDHGSIPMLIRNRDAPHIDLSGVKTDSIGQTDVSSEWDPHRYEWGSVYGAIEQEGFWTLPDGRLAVVFDQYVTDRATGDFAKVGTIVAFEDVDYPNLASTLVNEGYTYRGVLDLDSAAPVGNDDIAFVSKNGSVVIDVLANDFDPDGDSIAVDGFVYPDHGSLHLNDNGTVTYRPDPNYVGVDQFSYWVEDHTGNFTLANVSVTVDV